MSDDIQIRTVTVELLRAGPAHNQLLSPLTQYLGVCDDAEAGVITLPFEHAAFLRRMKSMRYVAGTDENGRSDRLPVLRELGVEMAKVLGAIPRLPGSLNGDAGGPDTLVHLRLVLSASELASLPFEQAKIPIGPTAHAEGWLSLQARVPVVITRRTRNVSEAGAKWPTDPRILFIVADPSQVPFDRHKEALLEAVRPYLTPSEEQPAISDGGQREQFGNLLTILKNASYDQVAEECATNRYTHVHILAHGAEDPSSEEMSYGLEMCGVDGDFDVISGERLASAFVCLVGGAIHRPAMVMLATCDSGNLGSVVTPGASMAHVLHQAGIALVVASQYPLSMDGSVLVARELYPGLLRGENPWILLHRIRTGLHGRVMMHSHDWASLVVYEALPANLANLLEETRYTQGKRAINAAIDRIDRAVAHAARSGQELEAREVENHKAALQWATDWLPSKGAYTTECLGLRASSMKRMAEAEFNIALSAPAEAQPVHVKRSLMYLEHACSDYERAVNSILVHRTGQAVQRVSSLHWVLVQQLCLSRVLEKGTPTGAWETAYMSAQACLNLQDVEERAWACGSLAELCLIRMTYSEFVLSQRDRNIAAEEARTWAEELVKLLPFWDAFPIRSTSRQFKRYVRWWGHDLLEGMVKQQYPHPPSDKSWKELGVCDMAQRLISILDRSSTREWIEPAPAAVLPPRSPAVAVAVGQLASANRGAAPLDTLGATGAKEKTRTTTGSANTVFTVAMLPADHGDCLWLEYGDSAATHRVLIDCGTKSTYKVLRPRIAALPPEEREFELFILSHIDADHIDGAIPFLKDEALGVRFGDIWFNGWKHLRPNRLGARQGEVFSALIQKYAHPWNRWRDDGAIVLSGGDLLTHTLPGGMKLTLLSPDRAKLTTLSRKWEKDIVALEKTPGRATDFLGRTVPTSTDVEALAATKFTSDNKPHNGSSIAVLAEHQGKSVLFGADAHAPLLAASIRTLLTQRGQTRLRLDGFKVPHHASQNNLNVELMNQLECNNYLISTNGTSFNHPDREAIARVIQHGGPQVRLWFNYRTPLNEVWADAALQKKYGYRTVYPEGEPGLLVQL